MNEGASPVFSSILSGSWHPYYVCRFTLWQVCYGFSCTPPQLMGPAISLSVMLDAFPYVLDVPEGNSRLLDMHYGRIIEGSLQQLIPDQGR